MYRDLVWLGGWKVRGGIFQEVIGQLRFNRVNSINNNNVYYLLSIGIVFELGGLVLELSMFLLRR